MPKICTTKLSEASANIEKRRRPKVAMPTRYRNRPPSIRRAIYLAWDEMDRLGLSISGVKVLQALIAAGVDANDPLQLIYTKKESLARSARVSESSVYRALSLLEEKGLIFRTEQKQRLDGSLAMTKIGITNALASLLGFVIPISSQKCAIAGNSSQEAESADDCSRPLDVQPIVVSLTQASLQAASNCVDLTDGVTDELEDVAYIREQKVDQTDELKAPPSVNYQSTKPGYERIGKYCVPVELVWIISENRLNPPQLFKLMKLAKTVPGQSISDYIELRKARIKELLSPNDCYRFLKKLITDNVDARFLVAQHKQQTHRDHRKTQAKAAEAKCHVWLRDREGQTYVDPSTDVSYTINASHGLLHVGNLGLPESQRPSLKISSKFITRVTSGQLVRYVPKANDRIKDAPPERLQNLLNILKHRPALSF